MGPRLVDAGYDADLAVDNAGRPHISYRSNDGFGLRYARKNGGT